LSQSSIVGRSILGKPLTGSRTSEFDQVVQRAAVSRDLRKSLAEHQPVERGVGLRKGDISLAIGQQRKVTNARRHREALRQLECALLRKAERQRVAAGEVVIGGGRGDADPPRYLAQAKMRRPAFLQHLARGFQQRIAQIAMVIGLAGRGFPRRHL